MVENNAEAPAVEKDEALDELYYFVVEDIATDDKTAGEGKWVKRRGLDGARIVMSPPGTHEATVQALCARVVTRFGGGHVGRVPFDPKDPSKGERLAIVIDGGPDGLTPRGSPTGEPNPGPPPSP